VTTRAPADGAVTASALLARVVEHYHQRFCARREGQTYLATRGHTDPTLLKTFQIGYADGSLLKRLPRSGAVREQLRALGVITAEGRELLGGCVVVPIPDPTTGAWTTLYGRGVRTARHCYLPGPLRGVLNFQAARSHDTVILTESILDALSFLQAGITNAMPIYGTNGFTSDHLDLLTREVLQSRKKLIAAAAVKDPQTGTLKTRIFTVEARAAFVEATTASSRPTC
jgi:DNA primase